MKSPKIRFRQFGLFTLSFLTFFSFIALPKPLCSTRYVVTYPELANMHEKAREDRKTAAEAIFRRIEKHRNNADQFYFDPNDNEYAVYIETLPEETRILLYRERDEWRILEYHKKIRWKKEAAGFLFSLGTNFMAKADVIEAARMFEYTKASDPFFLQSYYSLFMLYQELEEWEKAKENLNELEERLLILRQYDPNYMVVTPQEAVISPHIKAIQETIENTQLLEVQIQMRKYTVQAAADLNPLFVSEKAHLYAYPLPMFDFYETPIPMSIPFLSPVPQQIPFPFPKEKEKEKE